MTADSLELASLLCSRLCHDMLSPVGALSNGLELLAEEKDPEMRQRCFELLEQSARISAAKLKFFRLAFGAAGGFGDMVSAEEPRALIEGLLGERGRISLEWAVTGSTLPKPAIKVLLNLALIGIDAVPRGGTLEVGAEVTDSASEIVVRAVGAKVVFDEAIGRALDGTIAHADLSSRTAPAFMLHQMTSMAGGGIRYALGAEALVMGAVLPLG